MVVKMQNTMALKRRNSFNRLHLTTLFTAIIFLKPNDTNCFSSTYIRKLTTRIKTNQLPLLPRQFDISTHDKFNKYYANSDPNNQVIRNKNKTKEKKLLRLAKEYRRLSNLKTEFHLRTPKATVSTSFLANEKLAREAGYESLHDFEISLEKGRDARDTLISSNMGLVHRVTKQTLSSSTKKLQTLTYEDLIQEGSIGLSRAIDKYSFGHKTKFSTYAYYWIRASILRALAEKNEYIRVPGHITATVSKLSKAVSLIGNKGSEDDLVRDWAWREAKEAKMLAESIGEKVDTIDRAMEVEKRRRNGMVVLMGEEQQNWINMGLGNQGEENQIVMDDLRKEELQRVLKSHLKPKEAEALCLRYGLVEGNRTFRDYEAEAEYDLFGPSGILAPNSISPLKSTERISSSQLTNSAVSSRDKKRIKNKQSYLISRQAPKQGRWGEAMSFKEVGIQMAISAEHGRRLCTAGLTKLRNAVTDGTLDPGLLF